MGFCFGFAIEPPKNTPALNAARPANTNGNTRPPGCTSGTVNGLGQPVGPPSEASEVEQSDDEAALHHLGIVWARLDQAGLHNAANVLKLFIVNVFSEQAFTDTSTHAIQHEI
nr:hypothetical protein B0A51_04828 [Rachicladosporium sp. CCFEE 5018]